MDVKISKTYIFPVIILLVLVGFFWLRGGENSSQQAQITTQVVQKEQSGPIKEIDVAARQFEFEPNPIRVKLGETVRLNIKSMDVTHGFSLPAFGINTELPAGETVSVRFQATKQGEFPFACSVVCGAGHSDMQGTLIVE